MDTKTKLESLLSSDETGEILGFTSRRVRQLAADGILPFVRLPHSRELRFRPSVVARVIAENEHGGDEPKAAYSSG